MQIKSTVLILLILLASFTKAQEDIKRFTLTGSIVDLSNGDALPFATIIISHFPDNKYLTGTTTDDKGIFYVNNISDSIIRIKISMIGYQTLIVDSIDLETSRDIGVMKLKQAPYEMDAVTIKAVTPVIETHIDKDVINVDRVPGSNGTVTDVLRNSGAVEVNPQSNKISVRGQDVKIELDGHPAELTPDFLSQMPADLIDQIEVIFSPGARESAEGGAYILNLISKKSVFDDLNGSVSINAATSNRNTVATNLNYKKNKFNIFGSLTGVVGGNKSIGSTNQINYRNDILYNQIANRNYTNDFYMSIGKFGADYNYDEKNYFTLYSFTSYYKGTSESTTSNEVRDILNQPQYAFDNTENSDFSGYSTSVTGFYKRELDGKKHELTVDLYFLNLGIPSNNLMNVLYSNNPFYPVQQESDRDIRANTFIARLNYIVPCLAGSIETGYNFTTRRRENEYTALNYSYLQITWVDSLKLSNLFKYNEAIHSFYATYSAGFSSFEIKTGLRVEDLFMDGNQVISNERFKRNFLNLFPNLNIIYTIDPNWQFIVNAFRRVTYPQLDYVNPFRIYNGPNNYSDGNPDLKPSFISSYSASLSRYVTVYSAHSTDIVSNVTTVFDDSITFNKYVNLNTGNTYGLDLTLPYHNSPDAFISLPGFITMSNLQFGYMYYKQSGTFESENLAYSNKTWNLRGQLGLILWYDINATISFYYRSASENIRTSSKDFRFVGLSFNKNFFDQKLRMSLTVNDLLNTAYVDTENRGSNYFIHNYSKNPNSRAVTISFMYMFNNYSARNDRKVDDGRDTGNGIGF